MILNQDDPNTPDVYVASSVRSDASTSACGSPETLNQIQQDYDEYERFRTRLRTTKVACLGAGYVGGPTMAVMAKSCPDKQFYVLDVSKDRINRWNSDDLPVYEPGLFDVVKECRGRNLFFSCEIEKYVKDCDVIFVAVATPTKSFGAGRGKAADLTFWEGAARMIAAYSTGCKIIVEKSTVPVKTAESLQRVLHANRKTPDTRYVILSNPEFLAEGTAIRDLLNPDRVLIGGPDGPVAELCLNVLTELYGAWVPREKILQTNLWSSELAKLVSNAFLAQRISSINCIAMLCERTGADVREIAKAVGHDTRIGSKFLNASVGFGGSCLQKDILSLSYLCEKYGLTEAAEYWESVALMNKLHKQRFAKKIIDEMFSCVRDKDIAIFGFAYKKDTADVRCTPAIDVCVSLMRDGAILHVYDPKVQRADALREFEIFATAEDDYKTGYDLEKQFLTMSDPATAVQNCHAIVILTEWKAFESYNYGQFYKLMKRPAFVFDGRNILDHQALADIGFEVHGVGVPALLPSLGM